MEPKSGSNNALTISTVRVSAGAKTAAEIVSSPGSSTGKKRRRGAAQLIKVALLMIRRRSVKAKPVDVAAAAPGGNMLNRLVGSMRPLHLQSDSDATATATAAAASPQQYCTIQAKAEPPTSPAAVSDSTDGMSSRYASAENLQELDKSAGGGSESRYASAVNLREMDSEYDDGGDEMIDAKAEQFIAQFYAQIRLQRLDSIDRRYNEMIERSIA